METIIGITAYNCLKEIKECLKSIANSTIAYKKIVIVYSKSNDGTDEFLKGLPKEYDIIEIPKEGAVKAYKKLFEIAFKEKCDLFLTHSDVTFPKLYERDWLKNMKETSEIKDCGLVTCFKGMGMSGPSYLDNFRWVGTWCLYVPYKTMKKIGLIDDSYTCGEDIDYSYSVVKAGLTIYSINYWVDHHRKGKKPQDDDMDNLAKINGAHFKEKWKLQY